MVKKVIVSLHPGLLEQVDSVAKIEHRNRSDLVREALRRYVEQFKSTQLQNKKGQQNLKNVTLLGLEKK